MKKILVIGGAHQGKSAWTLASFPEYKRISFEELLDKNKSNDYSGKICLNGFHMLMKQCISEDKNYSEYIDMIVKNQSWIIIADEIGNGIVPLEKEDRRWREETGRALCKIAQNAEEVYRIYCGIPTQIKGGNTK